MTVERKNSLSYLIKPSGEVTPRHAPSWYQ